MIALKEAALEGKVEEIEDVNSMKMKYVEFGYNIDSSSSDSDIEDGFHNLVQADITIKDDKFIIENGFYKENYLKLKYGCPTPK